MAKKTVATLQTGKEGRSYTKVIKMVKSPKTGAYIFDEQMVPNEKVQDFFSLIVPPSYLSICFMVLRCRKRRSRFPAAEKNLSAAF